MREDALIGPGSGAVIRRLALTFVITVVALIVGLGIASYRFEMTLRAERNDTKYRLESNRTLVFVHLKSGWITVSLDHGSGYGGGPGRTQNWWGNAGVSRRPDNTCWWVVLPWWEAVPIFVFLPAANGLGHLRRRLRPDRFADAGPCPDEVRFSSCGRRSPLVTSLVADAAWLGALIIASVAILSLWVRFDYDAKNGDYGCSHGAWLNACATAGRFDVQFQRGTLKGCSFGPHRNWYGGFADLSDPGTVYWWLMLPGWLPASVLGGLAMARSLRIRRQHRGRCGSYGPSSVTLTGWCGEESSPPGMTIKAG